MFKQLRAGGQTFVIVTDDERVAATADRLISMRDGTFVDETRLTGGTSGRLAGLAGLEAVKMGKAFLFGRLAAKDLRRHLSEGVLLFVVIVAASATLTLGLVLHGVTNTPLQCDPGSDRGS
jgi:hypothetical protein